jgi:hypothetical protein
MSDLSKQPEGSRPDDLSEDIKAFSWRLQMSRENQIKLVK